MGEEVKKISFGFSKFTKKTQIVSSSLNQIKPVKSNVELIDCFESKAIKLKNPVETTEKILVIPLQRQQESLTPSSSTVNDSDSRPTGSVKLECNDPIEIVLSNDENKTDLKTILPTTLTLDEIAAREILQDLNDKKSQDVNRVFTVPLTNNPPSGEKESSLEDYENIPVGDFGVAMLRGMGWAPGKGIGKNEKLVTPSLPTLRPKGMGLGADKVLKLTIDTKISNDDLKMVKNSFIRVIAGQHKNSYGQIEGFDDETGRIVAKLALKNVTVSLNEFMVQLVDKTEFLKNSKVINVSKYEQYKDDERKKKPEKYDDDNDTPKSVAQQNSVSEDNETYKGNQHRPNYSTSNSVKIRKHDSDSLERVERQSENVKRKYGELPGKSHKLSNKRQSRSRSSSSSSTRRESLKISKKSFSKRARSSSSSTSSAKGYSRNKKSTKSKHKHKDSDKKSSRREKSNRKKKTRSNSTSSSSSSVSSDYYKKSVTLSKSGMKMSSSKRHQSKRRSQSPKKRDSSKKDRSKHR